jgi:hypothetical protein
MERNVQLLKRPIEQIDYGTTSTAPLPLRSQLYAEKQSIGHDSERELKPRAPCDLIRALRHMETVCCWSAGRTLNRSCLVGGKHHLSPTRTGDTMRKERICYTTSFASTVALSTLIGFSSFSIITIIGGIQSQTIGAMVSLISTWLIIIVRGLLLAASSKARQ